MKTQNKQELEEAIAEAEIHATLSHGNIVKYREVFRTGHRTVFIGMFHLLRSSVTHRQSWIMPLAEISASALTGKKWLENCFLSKKY